MTKLKHEDFDLASLQDELRGIAQLDQPLGSGGQRAVWAAVTADGDECVLKVMRSDDKPRAEREVEIGRRFAHPNLATVLSSELLEFSFEGRDYVGFLEQRIPGQALDSAGLPTNPCGIVQMTRDLVAAIDYLWNIHSIVHRDIKPANIIAAADGRYVLIDVGIGRHQTLDGLTSSPLGPGTQGYLAPEMLELGQADKFDARTDLFLVGIVMHEALTGQKPFRPSSPDYFTDLATGRRTRPTNLPEPANDLLDRLLADKRHSRLRLRGVPAALDRVAEAYGCS